VHTCPSKQARTLADLLRPSPELPRGLLATPTRTPCYSFASPLGESARPGYARPDAPLPPPLPLGCQAAVPEALIGASQPCYTDSLTRDQAFAASFDSSAWPAMLFDYGMGAAAVDPNSSHMAVQRCLEQVLLSQHLGQCLPPAPPPAAPALNPSVPPHCLASMPQYAAPTLDKVHTVTTVSVAECLGLGNLGLGNIGCSTASPPSPPAGPAPGSAELPSIGSSGHLAGLCKPCAFLHTKGCENGPACAFCHLCGPGEKKRRQKEKLEQRRAVHRGRPPLVLLP